MLQEIPVLRENVLKFGAAHDKDSHGLGVDMVHGRRIAVPFKENAMFNFPRSAMLGTALLGAALMLPAQANAIELSGAWTTEADLCGRVFTKKGRGIGFAELSDLVDSGFIIEGNRLRGKSTRCTITSKKQDGDNLELGTSCAASVMNQKLHFSLKVIDDNNLARQFPDIPGVTLKYKRCAL